MKNFSIILFLFSSMYMHAQKTPINYLYQIPPGMVAEVFAPGIISVPSNEYSTLAFSPSVRSYYNRACTLSKIKQEKEFLQNKLKLWNMDMI